jgi:hypothetical protein
MKRKTNLFYFNGSESNFLTFSNFTEHLTGNFISTDYKLFPSRFLCLNIPSLNDASNKENFIKNYLAGYYENKLAFLRDYYNDNNINVDNNIFYLRYLFDTLYKYDATINFNDIFIGNITEQDYNGTFTDIICTIEYFNKNTYSINHINSYNSLQDGLTEYEYDSEHLYGWDIQPENYSDIIPLLDNDKKYVQESLFESEFILNNINKDKLEFNIIIPLYDYVNINYNTNTTLLVESDNISINKDLLNDCVKNVPYGIWFANKTIVLERDLASGYTPSWSLLIGTQFKPFPNSSLLTSDINDFNNTKAYSTFAEILNKQNNVIDLVSKYNNIINNLNSKIKTIENNMNKMIDFSEIEQLKNQMQDLLSKFDNQANYKNYWVLEEKS